MSYMSIADQSALLYGAAHDEQLRRQMVSLYAGYVRHLARHVAGEDDAAFRAATIFGTGKLVLAIKQAPDSALEHPPRYLKGSIRRSMFEFTRKLDRGKIDLAPFRQEPKPNAS